MLCKKGFLKNSAKFTEKHKCWSLFKKVSLKRDASHHRCFPANIAKFLRAPFLWNTPGGCFYLSSLKFLKYMYEISLVFFFEKWIQLTKIWEPYKSSLKKLFGLFLEIRFMVIWVIWDFVTRGVYIYGRKFVLI